MYNKRLLEYAALSMTTLLMFVKQTSI